MKNEKELIKTKKRDTRLLILGFLTGIIGFFFLPSGFKAFAFFIPLIIICVVYSSDNDYFNMNLFLILGFIFFLLPVNLITMDANNPYNFNIMQFMSPFIDIAVILIFIGIPLFLLIGIVIALFNKNIGGATSALQKLIVILIFITLGLYLLNWMGVEVFGITRFVFNMYGRGVDFVLNIPVFIINTINRVIDWLNSLWKPIEDIANAFSRLLGLGDWLELPVISNVSMPSGYGYATKTGGQIKRIWTFDMLATRFDSMSQTERVFAVHNSLPLFMGIFCLISIFLLARKRWYKWMKEGLTRLDKEKKVRERVYFPNMNYKLIVFLVIIIIAAFGLYLSYAQIYKQEDVPAYQMFGVMGFFSIYLFMSIIPLILMNFSGLSYYKDSNLTNTVKGVIFGMMGLFLVFQIMNSGTTMQAMSMVNHSKNILYIINTFIFVAPSESIMFHVFLPALVMGMVASYTGKKTFQVIEYTNREELIMLEAQIMAKEEVIKIYENFKDKKKVAEERAKFNTLKQKRNKAIKKVVDRVSITEDSIFGRPASLIIIIVFGMLVPSFIFASFHYFSSGIDDYIIFWTCGLGVIFFVSSCWFIFIGMRYGWLSAILTHAIWNSLTIIFIVLFLVG